MKILFFSDAHGNHYAVERFFETSMAMSYDMAIFGGDVLGYYYGADRILDLLREHEVFCLLGNHDQMFLEVLDGKRTEESLIRKYGNAYKNAGEILSEENVRFLRGLSPRTELNTDGRRLVFVHGSVTDPVNGRVYPDAVFDDLSPYEGIDYVFCGHTHHKMEKTAGKTTIINPGSIGQQRDGKGCTFLIFDTDTWDYRRYEVKYDIEALVREIEEREDVMKDRLIEVLYRKPRQYNK